MVRTREQLKIINNDGIAFNKEIRSRLLRKTTEKGKPKKAVNEISQWDLKWGRESNPVWQKAYRQNFTYCLFSWLAFYSYMFWKNTREFKNTCAVLTAKTVKCVFTEIDKAILSILIQAKVINLLYRYIYVEIYFCSPFGIWNFAYKCRVCQKYRTIWNQTIIHGMNLSCFKDGYSLYW